MTMEEILKTLSEDNGAMIVRPASSKDLAQCQKDMAEIEMHPVPQGYIDFLREVNGFAWNGIEFFSTDQVTDPESNYTLLDIVTANEDLPNTTMICPIVFCWGVPTTICMFTIRRIPSTKCWILRDTT